MTDEELAVACVPIAARLAATVREYGHDEVSEVLRLVPGGRLDALCVVLAAMVDPGATPATLLAWLNSSDEFRRLTRAGVSGGIAQVLARGAA